MTSIRANNRNQKNGFVAAAIGLLLVGGISIAHAKGKGALLVQSATLVQTVDPNDGFIDDPFTFDRAGSRLLYVNSETGTSAKLVVLDVFQKTELLRVSLEKFTVNPTKVEFAIDGEHFLVWAEEKRSGRAVAALMSRKGKVIRKFGPAVDIVRTTYEGQDALVVHDVASPKRNKKRRKSASGKLPVVSHSVAVHNIATGRLIGKKTRLDLTDDDKNETLDFTLKFWANDFTVAVGIKGGEWDRKEDQRSPDTEGHYVMPTRTFSKRLEIKDLRTHRERMLRMEKHARRSRDIVVKHNLSGLDLVSNGEFAPIDLSEPFHHYDSTSLVVQPGGTHKLFFSITIDPVHPDAAAKRRAVKAWTDLYEYDLSTKKATRRARLLMKKNRQHTWRANDTHWALVPRHIGFDRGGSEMQIYRLK